MAILPELGQNLETLAVLVQDVRNALAGSEQAAAQAMPGLEADRAGLPQASAATRARFAESVAAAGRLRADLERLGSELSAATRRLRQDETARVQDMEARGAGVGARLEALAQGVGHTLRDVDARSVELTRGATASAAAVTADAASLGQSGPPVVAALASADSVLRQGWHPEAFADLETALAALRGDLDLARDETVPAAAQAVTRHLSDGHGPEVEATLAALATAASEARDAFGSATAASARRLREGARSDLERVDLVIHAELPESVRQAVDAQAVPALRRMAEEAARTWLAAGNTAAYLNKEQDPWYPAVRELHIALRGMVKGR